MRVLGFNLDKISIEKFKNRSGKLEIKANIDIPEIKKIESDLLSTKEELIQANFHYTIKYEPGFADVDMKGYVVLSLDEKQAKELMKDWKNKEMPEEFRVFLFNVIIRKASIKALQLEDELNLPLHLPLPTMKVKKEK